MGFIWYTYDECRAKCDDPAAEGLQNGTCEALPTDWTAVFTFSSQSET